MRRPKQSLNDIETTPICIFQLCSSDIVPTSFPAVLLSRSIRNVRDLDNGNSPPPSLPLLPNPFRISRGCACAPYPVSPAPSCGGDPAICLRRGEFKGQGIRRYYCSPAPSRAELRRPSFFNSLATIWPWTKEQGDTS